MKMGAVRKHALSLEAVTEEPHHNYSSFRVRGKIFVTTPPGKDLLHIFLDETARQLALTLHPKFTSKLLWGSKVLGLRIDLDTASPSVVKTLVSKAYETRVLKDAGPKTAVAKTRKTNAK